MKKQQITLLGETLTIVFNMACQIAFEEITGKPFNDFDSNKSKDILALDYAVISVNNPDTEITADRLMREANAQDMKILNNAITSALMDWNDIPATLADEEDNAEENSNNPDNSDNPGNPDNPSDQKNA